MATTRISADDFAALEGLEDWRVILRSIHATYRAASFAAAAELASAVATLADEADHHPDLDLRHPDVVHVALTTHVAGGLTAKDVDLARAISALARERTAIPEPTASQLHEIALDTMDAARIKPFWAAVLGYVDDGDDALTDPRRLGPPLWFQQMDEPRTDRDRFHIDISVPHDVAAARLDAALVAGGRLVTDRYAKAFWVLADADGNEACICTWQDRDGKG